MPRLRQRRIGGNLPVDSADVSNLPTRRPVQVQGYQGNATVATLNGLGSEAKASYVVTDSGTLTRGSVAVGAGDLVEDDGTNWALIKAGVGSTVEPGTRAIVGSGTLLAPLTDPDDRGKIAQFLSFTPELSVAGDGDGVLVAGEGAIDENSHLVYDAPSGPPTGVWFIGSGAIHALGGAKHSASALAALNALVNDATLDDVSASRPPSGAAGGDLAGTFPNPGIAAGVIVNADVNAGAAIAESKLTLNFATHDNANDPTAGEKAALPGTSGAPGAGNKYITDADARNSDARTPTGAAGGDLTGTFPNPGVVAASATVAGKIERATQAEVDGGTDIERAVTPATLASATTVVKPGDDHGLLGGLGDDDHAQYALLAGRAGGQTQRGGTGAGNDLSLLSTSNATKGKVVFGLAGNTAYDEVNERLGVGTSIPNATVDVRGASGASVGGFPSGHLHVTSVSASVNANAVVTGHNLFGGNKQLWYLGSISGSNDNIAFINRQPGTMGFLTGGATRVTIDNGGGVGIGVSTIDPSALLQLNSTTRGVLPPRMTTTQRDAIASPATGLTIYNTTTSVLNTFNGTSWVVVDSSNTVVRQSATVQTTDATVTTLDLFTLADETVVSVHAWIHGLVTGGDAAVYDLVGAVKRVSAGAATVIATLPATSTPIEDNAAWDATLDVSGNDVRVRVTGVAATTINWRVEWTIRVHTP